MTVKPLDFIEGAYAVQIIVNCPSPSKTFVDHMRSGSDDVNDVVKLDSDIEELKHFPERLSDSYRAEWESYVRRALVNEFKQHGDASPATFIASIMERVEAVQASNPRYAALMPIIERAQQVNHAENTHLFPSPWRQQIMALLLPVTAVTPPDKDNS